MNSDIYEIKERLCMELADVNSSLKKGSNSMDAGTLDILDKLTHAIKSVETIIAMSEANRDGSYYDGGYGRNQSRNSMGRYNAGYPHWDHGRYYDHDDGMMNELHTIMNNTSDERTRQGISNLLNSINK